MAQATTRKACLLGAVAAYAQGKNALRVSESIAPEESSYYSPGPAAFPAATAAAAAARFFKQAVQWRVQAGACKEARIAARSAGAAAKLAGTQLANADAEQKHLFSSEQSSAREDLLSALSLAFSGTGSLCICPLYLHTCMRVHAVRATC